MIQQPLSGKPFIWSSFIPQKAVTALCLTLTLLVVAPTPAEAGLVDFISNLFTTEEAEGAETASTENSQTMDLLSVASVINPLASVASFTVVEDGALESANTPASTLLADGTTNGQISTYTVRAGDSFSGIAKMFGVSVNTILWANDLSKTAVLKEGQRLVILPITGILHTVKSGDTVNSIAKKYKGDALEIADFNNLKVTDKLAVGDEVIIPDGESTVVTTVSSVRTTSSLRGAGGPTYENYYLRPVSGGRKSQGLHGYNGVDIAAAVGTPVLASASGVVIISKSTGYNGGYGQYVVLQHPNGTQTLYAHLSKNYVGIGEYVTQGQTIGAMGNTGRSTGSHLHFEIRGAKNPF